MKDNQNSNYETGLYLDQMEDLGKGKKAFDIWTFTSKGLMGVHREGVLKLLQSNGYRQMLWNEKTYIVRIHKHVLEVVQVQQIKGYVTNYVQSLPKELKLFVSNNRTECRVITNSELKEVFYNHQDRVFNSSFLANLQSLEMEVIKDEKDIAYIPFRNVVVKVTPNNVELLQYSAFESKVFFKSQVINADFENSDKWKDCHFARFIKNVSNDNEQRKNSIRAAIGYLLHNYSDHTKSQAVYLYDEELTTSDRPQGGTGKGVFAQAIQRIQKGFVKIDGKGINLKSQFIFQQIKEDTRIVFIDDVDRNFDVDRLNSVLSEGINVEKKFKSIIEIQKEEMPKFIIASNTILDIEGSTRQRRQYIIQFSNHYSSRIKGGTGEPIVEEHGCRFFSDDWDREEWDAFYTFMLNCLKFYLKNGLVETPTLNLNTNRYIHKRGGHLYSYFEQMELKEEHVLKELYQTCIDDNLIDEETSQRKFSNAFIAYLKLENLFIEDPRKGRIKTLGRSEANGV